MSEATGTEIPIEGAAPEGMFSMMDMFILSAMAGFAVYWFLIKNKKTEQPTFKKLTVQ